MPRVRSALCATGLLIVTAPAARAQSAPERRAPAPAEAVYAAVFEAEEGSHRSAVYVESRTLVYRPPGPDAWLPVRRQQDSLPAGLADRLRAVAARPGDTRTLPLPATVRVVSARRSRALQDRGLGATVVYALSPVAFTLDSGQALVYVERRCGPLCGSARAVWLSRGGGGRWTVRGAVLHSSS